MSWLQMGRSASRSLVQLYLLHRIDGRLGLRLTLPPKPLYLTKKNRRRQKHSNGVVGLNQIVDISTVVQRRQLLNHVTKGVTFLLSVPFNLNPTFTTLNTSTTVRLAKPSLGRYQQFGWCACHSLYRAMVHSLSGPTTSSRASNVAEYVQLVFNTSILIIILSIVVKFLQLIKQDVDQKVHLKISQEIVKVTRCQKDYELNGCVSHVPALEKLCDGWHHCMQSSGRVPTASLWTQTLAETLNAFVEPISFRSLIFVLLVVCALVLVTNVVIASYKVQYYFSGDGRASYRGSTSARIE